MDDLIGIIFVLVMVGLGLVGKVREQRRAAQEEAERKARRSTAGDLPPETRRQIYGSPDIPTARRRGEAPPTPQAVPRTVEPRVARPVGAPRTPPPVPGRPVQQQRAMRAPTERQTAFGTPKVAPRPQPVRREAAPPVMRSLRERVQEVQTQLQQAFEEAVEAPAQKPPPVRRAARPQREASRKKAREAAQPAKSQRTRRPPAAREPMRERRGAQPCVYGLFQNRNSVRRGIIMSEILGAPKAFR